MKKLISLLLVLPLLFGLLPCAALAEGAGSPVEIASAEDFLSFARQCSLESYSRGRVFSLTADLDLSGEDFTPVSYFAGDFRGNGHRISGLTVRGDGSRMGLFRRVAEGARISDLQVQGLVEPAGTRIHVGGIAGVNAGQISGCRFEGSVAGLENVGGIAGTNAAGGTILGCRFEGALRAEHQAGGIAGDNLGLIENCASGGSVNTVQIIPERERSFDLSAFSAEDYLDLVNIGGVAGSNGGTIRACTNEGAVGYAYTGYNVGGIAGRSEGFVTGCENSGSIRGRRDVGGVVGQLIPSAAWDFSEDRLNGLRDELRRLDEQLDAFSLHASERSAAVRRELDAVGGSVSRALDELTGVLSYYTGAAGAIGGADEIFIEPSEGLPELPEIDLGGADLSGLRSALGQLYADLAVLTGTLSTAVGGVTDDLSAVSAQAARVMECLDGLLGSERDVSLFEDYDLSADESYEHEAGAVDRCRSGGPVQAESNAGGIAGSIAFEISFDMEDRLNVSDFVDSDARRYLFAAVRACENHGEVEARSNCAGGVVGSADAGAVVDCVSESTVRSLKGDFVGGIAGSSGGCVRGCWSRSSLSGGKYLGGICGSGQQILGCRAWTGVERGAEYLGAVAGWAEGEVSGNYYVASSPAGVDDLSLAGQCDPLPAAELLALEGVPEGFGELTVRFVAEGRVVETRTIPYGGSVTELPELPMDGERSWKWDEFNGEHIVTNLEIGGRYCEPIRVLSSGERLPIFLVEGVFYEGQRLRAVPAEAPDEENLLSAWTLSVEGYEGELRVRMRMTAEAGISYLAPDGSMSPAETARSGSYLVFSLDNGGSFVCLRAEKEQKLPLLIACGAAALLLLLLFALLLRRRRRGKAAPPEGKAAEAPAPAAPEAKPEGRAADGPGEAAADCPPDEKRA